MAFTKYKHTEILKYVSKYMIEVDLVFCDQFTFISQNNNILRYRKTNTLRPQYENKQFLFYYYFLLKIYSLVL